MSDDAFFAEIQASFLQEAADLLGRVEALSLRLEKDPQSTEIYAELARLAHNFKGSGNAVGFVHIASLGHKLEDFILALKNKIVPCSPSHIDFLFKCLDRLAQDVDALTADKAAALDHTEVIAEIEWRLAHPDDLEQGAGEGESAAEQAFVAEAELAESALPELIDGARPGHAAEGTFVEAPAEPAQRAAQDVGENAAPETAPETAPDAASDAAQDVADAASIGGPAESDNDRALAIAMDPSSWPSEDKPRAAPPGAAKDGGRQASSQPSPKEEPKPGSKAASSEVLRIPKPKIDYLLEAFGEQVILQSLLEQCKFDLAGNQELIARTISQVTKLTLELQSHALSLTMIQLGQTFSKLERAIRDAARACDKQINVTMSGAQTEIDKTLVDSLSDALTHMVRNSVDHGIESAPARAAAGKPEAGSVTIAARRSGGQLWIEIADDGKGLDPSLLKQKAIAKGLIDAAKAEKMTTKDAFQLIFGNGFSTKDAVSAVSGRGVGMNVVQESVAALKGSIEIDSVVGKGTTFRLKLPLSLAIFNGAVVRVNENKFVVPNSDISEIARARVDAQAQVGSSQAAIQIRGEVFQLIDLRLRLGAKKRGERPPPAERLLPILITRKLANRAFVVDEVLGMQKIVQKPLGDEVKSHSEYAAGTILSDGSPGVILNLGALGEASAA
jgi:two-component system chemotaxis sensor kinase CheA